ncbi:hypothetical protein C0J45_5200 [Silurus meridionalis]|nr:hypothetical protein C0J45_5200 [Silurus meridionalis]
MASMKVSGSIPFLDDLKKPKKKKSKKAKKEKLDKHKSKNRSLKDHADICDPNLFAQCPEIKRKKKPDVEFFLTQSKNLKPSKRRKNSSKRAADVRVVHHGVGSDPGKTKQSILNSTQKEKKRKKRVVFNLPPELLEPQPEAFSVRDVLQTQCSGSDKKPSFNTVSPADGPQSRRVTEENGTGSQSTSEDINSQDLFITQKSFSDTYIDLCSSTSAEEALEPQDYAETFPEPPPYTASSARKRSHPEHHSLPKKPACPGYHPSPPHKLDASTQTENFFTSSLLATSLRFHHRTTCAEDPVDLSLPGRSRLHHWELITKSSEDQSVTSLTQSDDSDQHSKSKADLSQLKVVQTRLNESFFFRVKGEEGSPKPTSPLMKFSGGVEKKKPVSR